MILADTSIWIDFFRKDQKVFSRFRSLSEQGQIASIECIFGELLQGAKGPQERATVIKYWEAIPKVQVSDVWLQAGIYSSENKLFDKGLGLIDCVIIKSARSVEAQIWTKDKKILKALKLSEIYQ